MDSRSEEQSKHEYQCEPELCPCVWQLTNSFSIVSSTEKADNDNNSNIKNPNAEAHKLARNNRGDQLNPNNPEYKGDAREDKDEGNK